jgi:hypothetical protein
MRNSGELGVFALERGHLRPAYERGPGEDFLPASRHLLGHGRMLRAQVQEWNRCHFLTSLSLGT